MASTPQSNSITDQNTHDIHEQLSLEKRVASQIEKVGNNDPVPVPAWPQHANDHQYDTLLLPLRNLLQHLPTITATQNEAVIGRYYQDIVKELTTVYYALHTLVEKDSALSEAEREQRYQDLQASYQEQLASFVRLLGL